MTLTLDRIDLQMALTAVQYYLRGHRLRQLTPELPAFRLAHRLEEILAVSVDGHESVGLQQEWLTVQQAAQRIGKSERTARRIANEVGRKVGRQWLIPADALPEHEDTHDVA